MNRYLGGSGREESPAVLPCEVDPDGWFAEGTSDRARGMVAEAIRECRSCPVLVECGEWAAVVRPSHGVWAGRDWTVPPSHQPRGDRITRQQLGGTRMKKT